MPGSLRRKVGCIEETPRKIDKCRHIGKAEAALPPLASLPGPGDLLPSCRRVIRGEAETDAVSGSPFRIFGRRCAVPLRRGNRQEAPSAGGDELVISGVVKSVAILFLTVVSTLRSAAADFLTRGERIP
jgi:hypothetical protein